MAPADPSVNIPCGYAEEINVLSATDEDGAEIDEFELTSAEEGKLSDAAVEEIAGRVEKRAGNKRG